MWTDIWLTSISNDNIDPPKFLFYHPRCSFSTFLICCISGNWKDLAWEFGLEGKKIDRFGWVANEGEDGNVGMFEGESFDEAQSYTGGNGGLMFGVSWEKNKRIGRVGRET
jgi:hypothetical protein